MYIDRVIKAIEAPNDVENEATSGANLRTTRQILEALETIGAIDTSESGMPGIWSATDFGRLIVLANAERRRLDVEEGYDYMVCYLSVDPIEIDRAITDGPLGDKGSRRQKIIAQMSRVIERQLGLNLPLISWGVMSFNDEHQCGDSDAESIGGEWGSNERNLIRSQGEK